VAPSHEQQNRGKEIKVKAPNRRIDSPKKTTLKEFFSKQEHQRKASGSGSRHPGIQVETKKSEIGPNEKAKSKQEYIGKSRETKGVQHDAKRTQKEKRRQKLPRFNIQPEFLPRTTNLVKIGTKNQNVGAEGRKSH
jgi:hypothetical protein